MGSDSSDRAIMAESLAPTACTTIEEVGSTGVGALTITFLILAVSTVIFISRVAQANSTKKYYFVSIFICTFAVMASVSVVTTVKWFWFVLAALLLVTVIASFARGFKESANLRGPDVASLYGQVAALAMICFIFYPMVWLFSEGFASFSVSFEVCAYAMLDIVSKAIFCFTVMAGNEALAMAPDAYSLDYK